MKYLLALLTLTVVAHADDVLLRWEPNDPAEAVTQYNVYWRPVQTVTNWIRLSPAPVTNEVRVTSVLTLPNRVYQFTITAVNLFGESPQSDIVSYTNQVVTSTKPTKPTGLKVIKL